MEGGWKSILMEGDWSDILKRLVGEVFWDKRHSIAID